MKVTITDGKTIRDCIGAEGQTILELLQDAQISSIPAPCGGMGRCGKCKVFVEGRGEVLACKTPVEPGMKIHIDHEKASTIAEHGVNQNDYTADGSEELVAACDIGTTTVVCHLVDGTTGAVLATVSAPNEQKIYGADVVTRIERAASGSLIQMHEAVANQLHSMLKQLCEKVNTERMIQRLAVSGNTVMCHLLVGISPESIGVAPFMPSELFGREYTGSEIGIPCCEKAYVLPCVAGYVGADITADVLAAIPEKTGGTVLLLDIGTNGEMVLGTPGDGYVCCATAAGPAFEGAEIAMGMPALKGAIKEVTCSDGAIVVHTIGNQPAVGICGSGLLDALAVMLDTGLMDETGMLREKEEVAVSYQNYVGTYEGQTCVWLTETVCVTQEDIRNLQLAKAAIAAGICVLIEEQKVRYEDISSLLLAGGFGSYLNKESAARIGLIPRQLLSVTKAVGNAAGEGAIMAAISKEARNKLVKIQDKMRYLELSMHPSFSDIYMDCIDFESME